MDRNLKISIGAVFILGGLIVYMLYGFTTWEKPKRFLSWQKNEDTLLSTETGLNVSMPTKKSVQDINRIPSSAKVMILLLWTPCFAYKDCGFGTGKKPFKDCPHTCEITLDRKNIKKSDGVLFHARNVKSRHTLPKYRKLHQKWIFYNKESPENTRLYLPKFDGIFNMTVTYKTDSDVIHPYGSFSLITSDDIIPSENVNYASGKTSLIAWLVSHCHTGSRREKYVKELSRHVEIDVYGKCGTLKCGKNEHCFEKITEYKFYLAFENSLCRDYITEKAWRTLSLNVVPVVLGGADYSALLPPHSYIDVRDYSSPRALALHLKYIASNDTLYNSYFRWKQTYKLGSKSEVPCTICNYLHEKKNVFKTHNLSTWWNPERDCYSTAEFYKGLLH